MSGYVYRFLDDKHTVLYVGKTKDIHSRMMQHFTVGHLKKEQYEHVSTIEYIKYPTYNDASIMERVLIGNCNPVYNIQFKNEGCVTLPLPLPSDTEWTQYNIDIQSNKGKKEKKKRIISMDKIFLKRYKGCTAIYSDGSGFYFYNGRLGEYFYNFDQAQNYWFGIPFAEWGKINGCNFLSEYVDGNIIEWAKNDGVPIVVEDGYYFQDNIFHKLQVDMDTVRRFKKAFRFKSEYECFAFSQIHAVSNCLSDKGVETGAGDDLLHDNVEVCSGTFKRVKKNVYASEISK